VTLGGARDGTPTTISTPFELAGNGRKDHSGAQRFVVEDP
jgi:hypothetical protein